MFGAARPRSRPLRALIAGGGTGDGTVMLAQHLARAGRPGDVTYLDGGRWYIMIHGVDNAVEMLSDATATN